MAKPIFIATHPNFEKNDYRLLISLLFNFAEWKKEQNVSDFTKLVSTFFKSNAMATDSARSALYILLINLDIPKGSEVILPAFSCMVIANAVKWAGLTPMFADCNTQNFNYDLNDLTKKITQKTKVILVQHTFGFPEDITAIRKIVGKDIFIIEDLAHSLGGRTDNKLLGTLGDATILTFGIEKVISSIRGGMLVIKDEVLAKKISQNIYILPAFSKWKTLIALKGAVLWHMITPMYYWGIGKVTIGKMFVFLAHKLGIMGNMIEDCEYDTCKPKWLPSKMSPALAKLGMNQFKKLTRLNKHRAEIARLYFQELNINYQIAKDDFVTFLRFPVIVKEASSLILEAKREKIVLGDWYRKILYAPDKTLKLLGYKKGSCVNAEYLSQHIVNLPTHINVNREDALRICNIVKKYLI